MNLGRILLVASLVILAASGAWSQVDITWTDAAGDHIVALQNVENPNYDSSASPPTLELPYVWKGVIDIAMADYPIQFHVSGNFVGEWGEVWDQVRIEQHVTNLTSGTWDDFHIDIVDYDGEFYNMTGVEQGWNVNMGSYSCYMWTANPTYYVHPGEVFDDGVDFWPNVNYGTGVGSLTFEKWPSFVPEPGGLAVLVCGSASLFAGFLRRRRG